MAMKNEGCCCCHWDWCLCGGGNGGCGGGTGANQTARRRPRRRHAGGTMPPPSASGATFCVGLCAGAAPSVSRRSLASVLARRAKIEQRVALASLAWLTMAAPLLSQWPWRSGVSANPTTQPCWHGGRVARRAFFGAEALGPSPGGRLEAIQSSSSASGAVFSSQPWMQPPVPPKPPEPAPADTGQQGAIDGSLWRIDHDLRRTHWLCEHCNVALPRETAILCTRCGCASHASSHLDAAAAAQLFSHLSEARAANSLVALDVSHNPLGAVGAAALARLLRSLPFLTSLDCSGTSASDAGAIAICDALRSDHAGRSGNQCHGKPPMEGAAPPLRTLNLMGCSIKSAVLGACSAPLVCSTLRRLRRRRGGAVGFAASNA